ncbi:MAG: 3-dehydroquinate synthase [Francisellaceae bacterium]|jgi:3-dehydroquinate synthase
MTVQLPDHINVELKDRSYPIYFLDNDDVAYNIFNQIKTKHILIVTNETIAPLYLSFWKGLLEDNGFNVESCILPDGESFKNWQTLNKIFDVLLEKSYSRNSTLVALGGGVIGDMTGYAAASYQRGIHFVQVPTTLLAQVDSSVGGKTAINHPLGKNMIGAFYQPDAVYIQISVLKTLSRREFSSGLAEVIKYGCLSDYDFFCYLEKNIEDIMLFNKDALKYTIQKCCQIKASIVAEDETEKTGRRALLNFGHTFGHAIEAKQKYTGLLHGEAIAVGMLMATKLSISLGLIESDFYVRLKQLLIKANLPVSVPDGISVDDFIYFMRKDKKSSHGKIKLIILEKPGLANLNSNIDEKLLIDCMSQFL